VWLESVFSAAWLGRGDHVFAEAGQLIFTVVLTGLVTGGGTLLRGDFRRKPGYCSGKDYSASKASHPVRFMCSSLRVC